MTAMATGKRRYQILLAEDSAADVGRESILNPGAKIVAGYQNIMPTFEGQVTEEDLLQLIEYIKSLAKQPAQGAPTLGAIPPGLARRGTTLPPAAPAQNPKR